MVNTSLLSPVFDAGHYARKGDSDTNKQGSIKAAVVEKSLAVQLVSGKDGKDSTDSAAAAAVLSKRKKEDTSVRASLSAVAM